MIYVFDTSSFSEFKHFYPGIFKSMWAGLDELFKQQKLISTREVWTEIQRGNPAQHVNDWLKVRKELFTTPVRSNCNSWRRFSEFPIFKD